MLFEETTCQKERRKKQNIHPEDLSLQQKIHFDQYLATPVLRLNWEDVGLLMQARIWVMAFHQDEFGPWNWWLMLFIAIILAIMSLSAMVSYIIRKRKGSWGIPKVPKNFVVGYGILGTLILLGIAFPLFGISILIIFLLDNLGKKYIPKKSL